MEQDTLVTEKAFEALTDLYWDEYWSRHEYEKDGICPDCQSIIHRDNIGTATRPVYDSSCDC